MKARKVTRKGERGEESKRPTHDSQFLASDRDVRLTHQITHLIVTLRILAAKNHLHEEEIWPRV